MSAGTTNVLSNLTLADAFALGHYEPYGQGYIIVNSNGCAVSNAGSATLVNCTISNCVNNADGGQCAGAVYNAGKLAMQNCLFDQIWSLGAKQFRHPRRLHL